MRDRRLVIDYAHPEYFLGAGRAARQYRHHQPVGAAANNRRANFSTVGTRLPDASPWNTTSWFMDPHHHDDSDRYGWPERENGGRQLLLLSLLLRPFKKCRYRRISD